MPQGRPVKPIAVCTECDDIVARHGRGQHTACANGHLLPTWKCPRCPFESKIYETIRSHILQSVKCRHPSSDEPSAKEEDNGEYMVLEEEDEAVPNIPSTIEQSVVPDPLWELTKRYLDIWVRDRKSQPDNLTVQQRTWICEAISKRQNELMEELKRNASAGDQKIIEKAMKELTSNKSWQLKKIAQAEIKRELGPSRTAGKERKDENTLLGKRKVEDDESSIEKKPRGTVEEAEEEEEEEPEEEDNPAKEEEEDDATVDEAIDETSRILLSRVRGRLPSLMLRETLFQRDPAQEKVYLALSTDEKRLAFIDRLWRRQPVDTQTYFAVRSILLRLENETEENLSPWVACAFDCLSDEMVNPTMVKHLSPTRRMVETVLSLTWPTHSRKWIDCALTCE